MVPPKLPPKKDVAIALLQGPSLFVHIDPRKDGVVVPTWFKKKHQLVLQVGINMAVPIHDLDVGDDGIGGTLSFNRQPHWCFMPWSAIYALVGEDQRGMVWPEDVPPELAAQQRRPSLSVVDKGGKPKAAEASGEAKRPRLAAVPDEPAESSEEAKGAEAEVETEPARPSEPNEESVTSSEPAAVDEPATAGPAATTEPPAADKPSKPDEADGSDDAKGKEEGKRELPPYLRVIK